MDSEMAFSQREAMSPMVMRLCSMANAGWAMNRSSRYRPGSNSPSLPLGKSLQTICSASESKGSIKITMISLRMVFNPAMEKGFMVRVMKEKSNTALAA